MSPKRSIGTRGLEEDSGKIVTKNKVGKTGISKRSAIQGTVVKSATPAATINQNASRISAAAESPKKERSSVAKLYNTPGKAPKKVTVVNVTNKDDIKIIKRVSPKRTRRQLQAVETVSSKISIVVKKDHLQQQLTTQKTEKLTEPKVIKLRSPKKAVGDVYKSRHNIGRRSAGRVSSYKESEVAVLFPDDYQWRGVKSTRDSAYHSQTTASSSESDDDKEIIFKTPKKVQRIQKSKLPLSNARTLDKSVSSSKGDSTSQNISPKRKRVISASPDKNAKNLEESTKSTKQQEPVVKTKASTEPTRTKKTETTSELEITGASSVKDKRTKLKKVVLAEKRRKSKFDNIRPRAPRIQRTACLNAAAINSLLCSNTSFTDKQLAKSEQSDEHRSPSIDSSPEKAKKPTESPSDQASKHNQFTVGSYIMYG